MFVNRNYQTLNVPVYFKQDISIRHLLLVLILVATTGITACASQPKQPVLYPNNHLKQVGDGVARRDISACMQLARSSGVNVNKDGQVASKAAGGAAIGGASAGAYGLVRGNDAGNRALAGAAAGVVLVGDAGLADRDHRAGGDAEARGR